jgi:hypothetical protein
MEIETLKLKLMKLEIACSLYNNVPSSHRYRTDLG